MAGAALPDGRRALSASADKTLKLWDLETGNPLAAFTANSDLFAVGAEFGTHLIRAQHRAGQRADRPAPATAIALSEVADPAISA